MSGRKLKEADVRAAIDAAAFDAMKAHTKAAVEQLPRYLVVEFTGQMAGIAFCTVTAFEEAVLEKLGLEPHK